MALINPEDELNLASSDIASFLAVAESGHLTETAARLGVPQPTLSRRIARLEEELGATLFDRVGRTLQLNTRGRAFQRYARALLSAAEAGSREVHRLMDPELGTVRIGFMHSLGTWLVPALLREYRARYPKVQFELRQGPARELEQAVLDDALDLAFVSPEPASTDVAWTTVAQQRLGLAVPAGHKFATKTAVKLSAAKDEPFIGMLPGYGIQIILNRLAADAGFEPKIAFETMEMTTVAGLVAAGLGVALLPMGDSALVPEGVSVVPLTPTQGRDIGMIWRAGLAEAPPVELFRQFVLGKMQVLV
ncbi:LysR substrate-binding domain-containing protein [Corynebacterium sp. H128]|uniref:LysR substrate-binding domain-containing protein n=1 Tax=unclassified Corynebacterium TaxID=2624378 RepID=UPI0030952AE1